MSEHERGAYAPPTDAPITFDARQPVRGARPAPYALIISVLVLIAIAALVFVFYRSGVRQAGQAPQVVGEPLGQIRTDPPAEAQPTDPAAGLQIYRAEPGQSAETPQAPTFAPPPEQPQARQAPPPVVVTPPVAAPTARVAPPAQLPPAAPAAPPPKVIAQAPPAAKPAPAPKAAPTPAPPPKAPPPAATQTATPAAKSSGGAAVQIGAFSSQALADKGLKDAASIAGGGRGKDIQKIERDGNTLYRTAVTGFASRAEAAAYCDKLKAAGKSCFVR